MHPAPFRPVTIFIGWVIGLMLSFMSGPACSRPMRSTPKEMSTSPGSIFPGDILGHAQIDGHHAESAVALETSSVCELTDAGVAECARNGLASILVRMFGEHSVQGTRHQLNLKQTSAQARFAGFCLLFSDRLAALGRSAEHLPTPMSRTDIASYLGMTLESLSRVISRLTQAGVIKASRNHIEILQPQTLETFGMHVR